MNYLGKMESIERARLINDMCTKVSSLKISELTLGEFRMLNSLLDEPQGLYKRDIIDTLAKVLSKHNVSLE